MSLADHPQHHPYRVAPGSPVDLNAWPTWDDSLFPTGKREGRELMQEMAARIGELQEMLYAESQRKLLVMFQAMDTGGKDGTIRAVFSQMDPHGVRPVSFKRPGAHELARDYLWRIHAEVPRAGECVVFNRSHYEDIVAVRVRALRPEEVWSRRYGHILDFERMLADEGTVIVKIFLHISADEQKRRLQARLDDPSKHWKFNPGDLDDRALWPRFMEAYSEVISRTSAEHAPWHVVPADLKWHRNLAVGQILLGVMRGMGLAYPATGFDPEGMVIP